MTPGPGDSARDRSGVNVWGYMSLDTERGILYMPLGAPNDDRVGVDRPGDNLFSSSIVAVDANTGRCRGVTWPGEQASPTQPFPVKPEALTQNTISRDDLYMGEPSIRPIASVWLTTTI